MSKNTFRAFLAVSALAGLSAAQGCVADRPSRNGVFDENQYIRKDFLIRNGQGGTDPGWILKATVTQVSTPNALGGSTFGLFPGAENGGELVRFAVTSDKLQMLDMREIQTPSATDNTTTPSIVNAWPITNVDLKYRINLDGEKTNFYEENQELDWQVRQWVKVNFDKNDMSDVAPLGPYFSDAISNCTDIGNASTTLVPNSFLVDETNEYMQWSVSITVPIKWDDAACQEAFSGSQTSLTSAQFGRQTETFNLMYSMVRPEKVITGNYIPMPLAEKDPIRRKYGIFDDIVMNRDPDSGQLAATSYVTRWDPTQPIVWYFDPDFPQAYKSFLVNPADPTDPTTVQGQTNQLLADSGATARLSFLEANDPKNLPAGMTTRQYGDVRYSFLRWISDEDVQDFFAGVTQFVMQPMTGQIISASINFNDFAIKDYYVQRLDSYLQTIGASYDVNSTTPWPTGTCTTGQTMPIVPATVAANHNGNSTLFQKMQGYLQKPVGTYPNLGPLDFIQPQDDDFRHAYYALLPYYVFADPASNPYVIGVGNAGVYGPSSMWPMLENEAQFHAISSQIDHGIAPFEDSTGPNGLTNSLAFLNNFRNLTSNHTKVTLAKNFTHPGMHLDTPDAFSFEQMVARDARHCINGQWETRDEWVNNLISTYWSQVVWHEFGHSMGLAHNFMASIDEPNFPIKKDANGKPLTDDYGNPAYGLYASSVMEYNAAPDRVFWEAGWAPYDQGAISWIYANNGSTGPSGDSISGQSSSTNANFVPPWKDPHGFNGKTEIQYLSCQEQHLQYSPFCRQGDSGTTPSEIIANAIDDYEWQFNWTNYRAYRKFWNNSTYADGPAGVVQDMRKFISLWVFDWSSSELADTLRRIGIVSPDPSIPALQYYTQLTDKFNAEASSANQLVAAFHEAIIQQGSGERPFATAYDKFYGDVTKQGIQLDKQFAMQAWTGLWPTDNYDPNQAGNYIASYEGLGDSSYNYVSEQTVNSMIGGAYDTYAYFAPLAVALFAQDTHSPSFSGNVQVRNWIGGQVFYRLDDFLSYFRNLAVQNNFNDPTPGSDCTALQTCLYDPRTICPGTTLPGTAVGSQSCWSDTHNEFLGPDQRKWIWAYVPDRNTYVAVQKEINTASYLIVRNYTDDVIYQLDDGSFPGGAFGAELPMKYFLDSFQQYN